MENYDFQQPNPLFLGGADIATSMYCDTWRSKKL